jgi:UDP-N-acetylmuramate dehydrogenase
VNWQESFIAWCKQRDIRYLLQEPLASFSWIGIGGAADVVVFPQVDHISEMLARLSSASIPYFCIGKGSNVLISDAGFRGVIIVSDQMNYFEVDSEQSRIAADCGTSLQQIVHLAAENGLAGTEGLAGIPGTIAGAVSGNAGSFGVEIADVVDRVAVTLPDGSTSLFSAAELHFSYRFAQIPAGAMITKVYLTLQKSDALHLLRKVRQVRAEKRRHQPIAERSLGCVFKNPPGESAGRLIEMAGCKGMQEGGIVVSPLHANFFINAGRGTAEEYLRLLKIVQERVRLMSGVLLEPEIRFLGQWGTY